MKETDVIIVGAGLSGLSAATELKKQGLNTIVLEATDRVGGRLQTKVPKAGDAPYGWNDEGGSFVGATQYHVMRMCKDLGLQTYEGFDELDGIHYTRGKSYVFGDVLPNVWWSNPLAAWDMRNMVRRLEQMCWEVPVDKPWEARRAKEWDQMTVKDFYDKNCWTKYCHEYMYMLSTWDNTADGAHMSLLFYLWYIRQANGPQQIWGWEDGGADAMKIVGGSQQLAEILGQRLGEGVLLNHPVVKIQHTSSGVTVRTLNGLEYKAKYLILAIPPTVQMKIHFEPALPTMRSCLLQRSPMGLVMKCSVAYKEAFWEKNGYNGFVGCSDPDEIVGLTFNDRKPGIELNFLTCFVFLDHMVKMAAMSDAEKQDAVCKCLAKFFKSKEAMKPVHFFSKNWSAEQYVCGGYTCYYPPGVLTSFGRAIRAPIGTRVFLAGTETATHWTGYMDGAIDAGERAAREVLRAEGQIKETEVWVQKPYQPQELEQLMPSIESVVNLCWAALALTVAVVIYRYSF